MRISMQILADRLSQNYPDCRLGVMSEEMNLKRPFFYQNETELKKNKVYIAAEQDITEAMAAAHGDNLLLIVGMNEWASGKSFPGVCFFPSQYDPKDVFNSVQRIFDIYDAWDEKMQQLALSARTLKTLLDGSRRIFRNPILVSTKDGFVIDHSSQIDALQEFQDILQRHPVTDFAVEEESAQEISQAKRYEDPITLKSSLLVDIYDKNRNVYRVIIVEASRKLKIYDECLLLHLAKYIRQMLEKYTVLQSDISYTLDRLLSNVLTEKNIDAASLGARFENFHWKEEHTYFCMNIHMSTVDRQNQTVIRFICNRLEGLIKGSCAFLLDGNIVVYVNLHDSDMALSDAVRAAEEFLRASYLKAGISYAFSGLRFLKQYYLQSRVALEEGMKRYPLRWVNRFEDIALDYLLGKCTERLEPAVVGSPAVLTLKKYDLEHKTEYYRTLRAYIACQMNAVRAAKALFIHRSTFLYRMAHIKELVSLDLEDPDQLLYLLMTCKLLEKEEKA